MFIEKTVQCSQAINHREDIVEILIWLLQHFIFNVHFFISVRFDGWKCTISVKYINIQIKIAFLWIHTSIWMEYLLCASELYILIVNSNRKNQHEKAKSATCQLFEIIYNLISTGEISRHLHSTSKTHEVNVLYMYICVYIHVHSHVWTTNAHYARQTGQRSCSGNVLVGSFHCLISVSIYGDDFLKRIAWTNKSTGTPGKCEHQTAEHVIKTDKNGFVLLCTCRSEMIRQYQLDLTELGLSFQIIQWVHTQNTHHTIADVRENIGLGSTHRTPVFCFCRR